MTGIKKINRNEDTSKKNFATTGILIFDFEPFVGKHLKN